jgi:hypothetical protein
MHSDCNALSFATIIAAGGLSVGRINKPLEVAMTDSRRIAGLLGATLIALTASEAMNSHIWATVPA